MYSYTYIYIYICICRRFSLLWTPMIFQHQGLRPDAPSHLSRNQPTRDWSGGMDANEKDLYDEKILGIHWWSLMITDSGEYWNEPSWSHGVFATILIHVSPRRCFFPQEWAMADCNCNGFFEMKEFLQWLRPEAGSHQVAEGVRHVAMNGDIIKSDETMMV